MGRPTALEDRWAHLAALVSQGTAAPQSRQRIPKASGMWVRIWRERFPSDAKHYELKLASEVAGRLLEANAALAGKPTDPEKFSDEDLRERELS
jgi:hypothetical protein